MIFLKVIVEERQPQSPEIFDQRFEPRRQALDIDQGPALLLQDELVAREVEAKPSMTLESCKRVEVNARSVSEGLHDSQDACKRQQTSNALRFCFSFFSFFALVVCPDGALNPPSVSSSRQSFKGSIGFKSSRVGHTDSLNTVTPSADKEPLMILVESRRPAIVDRAAPGGALDGLDSARWLG